METLYLEDLDHAKRVIAYDKDNFMYCSFDGSLSASKAIENYLFK